MQPKEFQNAIYEYPKEGEMRVPVRVVSTKEMLDKMMTDRTLKQAQNVAHLPGILEASYVMPDGHEGYGFPIGGVAAFDPEEGIVSPGGVGYDINCLAKGSRVMHGLGFSVPIENYKEAFTNFNQTGKYEISLSVQGPVVESINLAEKRFESQKLIAFMEKPVDSRMLEIITKSGLTIRCSEDHPILSGLNMKKAGELVEGDKVAVSFFEGIEIENIPTSTKTGIWAKILGYLIGDGTLTFSGNKARVVGYGKAEDLKQMKMDLQTLGFNSSLFTRSRNSKIASQYGIKEFVGTSSELHVYSQEFSRKIKELGMPQGKKTSIKFNVPEWIMKSPLWVKRLFLAGFFGAELTSPSTHSKTGFYSPILAQNKNKEALASGRQFLIQIMELLDEFGIRTTKLAEREEYFNKEGKTFRLRMEISADEENLLKLWRIVGFEYNHKRKMLAEVAAKYIMLKKKLTDNRTRISSKVKDLRQKGLKLIEVQQSLRSAIANDRFIERAFYEKVGTRIPKNTVSFKEFLNEAKSQIDLQGALSDEIESIKEIDYSGKVYDFTVANHHNFISDGFIVSNCGVRLIRTDLNISDVTPKLKQLVGKLYENVPSGVGSKSKVRLNPQQLEEAVTDGLKWAHRQGYATSKDLDHCEENGYFGDSDYSKVSDMAKKRGGPQIGTLGAGNHFMEVQRVEKIFDPVIAKAFGITGEGQITIMVHSGSRGYGH
ncbi:MAG: RtcB family protein, partial [Candidatus Micrarchaeota archaeon]